MDKEETLGKGNVFKLMMVMGLPTMVAQIINLLYSIIDRVYIGHIQDIGGNALTGVGLCTSLIIIISAFAAFVGNGGAPLASVALGRKNHKEAEKILGNGISFLILMALVLMVFFYLFEDTYFPLVGGSDETSIYGKDYLNIYLIGTLFVLISLGLNNFIVAQGKSVIAMISIIIGAVINIGLDPIFIYGFNMGVKGAAIATVISQGVSALWIVGYLCSKHSTLKVRLEYLKPDFRIITKVAALGVSPFVMSITESIITFALSSQMKKYGGDDAVGSLTILQSTMQLMSTPLQGFTQGVTSLMAYNYGSKQNDRLKKIFKYLLIILWSYTFIFALAAILFPEFFSRMFTNDTSIVAVSTKYMPIFFLGMLIFGVQRTCQTSFIAMGQARTSLLIALLRKVILLVPLAFILPLSLGLDGVYISEPIADALAATICGIVFMIRFPKILKNNI